MAGMAEGIGEGRTGKQVRSPRRHGGGLGTVRKPSTAGDATKAKLLDAAECLFADRGYDGTPLRDIAKAAGVHMALSTYHFGSKEALFAEVIRRRAVQMTEERLATLAQIDLNALSQSEAVRVLIGAYVTPLIRARYSSSKQLQAHVRLMAALVNVKRWAPLVSQHYDAGAKAFIDRWSIVLPGAKRNALLNAFSFMVVAMLYVCSNTGRFSKWKTKAPNRKAELEEFIEHLVSFVHGGFMSLVSGRSTWAVAAWSGARVRFSGAGSFPSPRRSPSARAPAEHHARLPDQLPRDSG